MDILNLLILTLFLSPHFINAFPSPLYSLRSPHICSEVQILPLPGASVVSLQRGEKSAFTLPAAPPLLLDSVSVPSICEINITLTHPAVDDKVNIQVWLPLEEWNGRFVALGGSGWAAGHGPLTLGPAVAGGFAAASTDAGVFADPSSPALWALKENGEVNLGLLTNFASRSVHEMAVIGKAVTESYYGKKPTSYWNGCSTGGRQGLVAAQQYPDDFDRILAGAPAIYWPTYVMAELWPQVVMKEEGIFPSQDELNAVVTAAVAVCDGLDGIQDNVITDLAKCNFDPSSVVGKLNIDGKEVTITSKIASIVKKIWEGPIIDSQRLWYGMPIGAPLDSLANTTLVNGTRAGLPFFVPDTWIRYFIEQDPDFQISSVGSGELGQLFSRSQTEYDNLFNNANPDLSRFQSSGGKLLVWHGEADQLIYPQGSTQYRQCVEKAMGGGSKVDIFFRYFQAPGVDHCGLGSTPGARPSNAFEALIAWVEEGIAPEALKGQTPPSAPAQFTRKICRYPLVPKYRGFGDASSLESFDCVQAS
ncbi:tannase and feruloyl esterase [Zopfia rhizophila CBS 207.26]|uniref:Carboxylic ester hydrolase n=1 Tax=Zopfia rhizophila CBS 207.26 TaxID=1314779 RepID=A0A6A6ENE3_9PEZI|nr:tannase and feruloyl esterase [Zopfia rhizophila CBS 207.26]